MSIILQVDFPFNGPFGKAMTEAMSGLAESIANEPGLMWKIWTENESTKEAGGIYLFDTEENATAYIKMHTERMKAAGVSVVNAKLFHVGEELSVLSKASLSMLK